MVRALLTFCFLLNVLVAAAQQYNFRNWTLEHGLPQSKVVGILQDEQRHLWLATRGGVSRFNGNTFTTFTKRQGLSSNNITALFEDSRGQIWIGTVDNGLNKFTGDGFVHYSAPAGLPDGGIASIAEDKQGRLWVATTRGLYYLSGNTFNRYTVLPAQPYSTLLFDKVGILWAGSKAAGLFKVQKDSLAQFTMTNSSLPTNEITTLFLNKTGTLWIGTTAGVATIKDNNLQTVAGNKFFVTGFAQDRTGNTWVAFKNNGLLRINGDKITSITKENGLRTNNIVSIAADIENNIWIGTNGYGLQQYRAPWFQHYFKIGQVEESRITSIAKDKDGTLWAGSDNGLIFYKGQQDLKQYRKSWPLNTSIYSLLVKGVNDLWVGTSHGAWRITAGSEKQFTVAHGLPSDEIRDIKEDNKGNVWLATANGIALYQNGTFNTIQLKNDSLGHVYVIFTDSKQQLWFGAENGIYTWKDNKLIRIENPGKENIRDVTTIAEDDKGTLYFGGFNYGLLIYDPETEKAKLFSTADGLPNDGIKSLFVNNDHLWVGTNNNVLKVDLRQLRRSNKLMFDRYSSQNGFTGLEVCHNCITQDNDSTLWFGTAKGLTKYVPALDHQNKIYPELLLTDIKLFMRPVNWKKLGYVQDSAWDLPQELKLPFNRNHITFNYHAICLTDPSGIRYKYKLAGYDDQWSEITPQSFATYANLDPGSYTFQVIARNNSGYWTPRPTNYTFSVNAPIWQREWFIGLMLIFLSGVVLGVIRLRERGLKKMNKLLDLRVKHRTRLLERKHLEKEMLLKEIHHRVKNNLQIVISLLNLQARHVNDPQAQEAMQAIRSRVRSMSLLHERLYQLDNLARINLENYLREICESLYEAFGVTKEDIALTLRIPPIQLDIDTAITLGLIVNELVSNSLKYAFVPKQKGELCITLTREVGDKHVLTVQDNGTGIPLHKSDDGNKPFGLHLVASLSRKLDGEILFKNNNGTKAILYFVLPS